MTENFTTKDGKQVAVYPNRFPLWKSDFRLHTFEEEIEFIQGLEKSTGKKVGIYPEIKAPWFHHQNGKDIAKATLEVLKKYGYTKKSDMVYLQTFDYNELKRIKTELMPQMGMDLKLVQLVAYNDWHETEEKDKNGKWVNYDYDWMFKEGAMKEIAKYADGVGPGWYMLIDDKNSKVGNIVYTPMVKDIATTKMELHPYTVRKDALPDFFTDVNQMYDALYNKAGATGVGLLYKPVQQAISAESNFAAVKKQFNFENKEEEENFKKELHKIITEKKIAIGLDELYAAAANAGQTGLKQDEAIKYIELYRYKKR